MTTYCARSDSDYYGGVFLLIDLFILFARRTQGSKRFYGISSSLSFLLFVISTANEFMPRWTGRMSFFFLLADQIRELAKPSPPPPSLSRVVPQKDNNKMAEGHSYHFPSIKNERKKRMKLGGRVTKVFRCLDKDYDIPAHARPT